jgi:hypothetical protein
MTNKCMNTDHASNENDAKACYDRMIASLMSLLNRARGMNKNWVATRASILTEARYHIKTMLGLSEDHYTHSEESRVVFTLDIPGAFMHADMDELVHMKLEGPLAELLTKVDPDAYRKFITERGKPVIYVELAQSIVRYITGCSAFLGKFVKIPGGRTWV